MGVRIHRLQPVRIYIRITLRGGQGCVTQEFLDGPEIAAAGQQMGGKAVTKSMWRGRFWQTQKLPHHANLFLRDAWVQARAAHTDKQRVLCFQIVGTKRQIVGDGPLNRWQDRDNPLLAALAHYVNYIRVRPSHLPPIKANGFADAKSTAI